MSRSARSRVGRHRDPLPTEAARQAIECLERLTGQRKTASPSAAKNFKETENRSFALATSKYREVGSGAIARRNRNGGAGVNPFDLRTHKSARSLVPFTGLAAERFRPGVHAGLLGSYHELKPIHGASRCSASATTCGAARVAITTPKSICNWHTKDRLERIMAMESKAEAELREAA